MTDTNTEGLERLDLDDPERGIMAYAVGGKVTTEQAQELFDQVRAAASEGRKLRLYYELNSLPSAEPGVFIEKLKHMREVFATFERLAIVGDQRWLAIYTAVFDPITKMQIRQFATDQRDEAVAWIQQ